MSSFYVCNSRDHFHSENPSTKNQETTVMDVAEWIKEFNNNKTCSTCVTASIFKTISNLNRPGTLGNRLYRIMTDYRLGVVLVKTHAIYKMN